MSQPNNPHKLTKAAERWLGGGAALGGSNCTPARQPHLVLSESHVSRGGFRAEVWPAW